MTNRHLVAFDSFEGLPENDEPHEYSILGHSIKGEFDEGEYAGTLSEVESAVAHFGEPDVCSYQVGWFDDTLPLFDQPIAAAYIDVDLASSTRTCLRFLYPLLSPGGVLVSQDGDFPLVIEVFDDNDFWENEVGTPKPPIEGLGTDKMIKIIKPLHDVG